MGPELDLRPQLERLDRLICWSEDIDEGALTFAFRPLWQLDEPARAALALSRAQATQVYAGLKLWPDAVVAKLAEAQLVADGTYPNAAAVFAEAGTTASAGARPTHDYDPAQPRDLWGRWTSGGAGAGALAGAAGMPGHTQSHAAQQPGGLSWLLNLLNPIGTAQAAEEPPERLLRREGEPAEADDLQPDEVMRIRRFEKAWKTLKELDPDHRAPDRLQAPGAIPTEAEIQTAEATIRKIKIDAWRKEESRSERVSPLAPQRIPPQPPLEGYYGNPQSPGPFQSALYPEIEVGPAGVIIQVKRPAEPEKVDTPETVNSPKAFNRGAVYEVGVKLKFDLDKPDESWSERNLKPDAVVQNAVVEIKFTDDFRRSMYNYDRSNPFFDKEVNDTLDQALKYEAGDPPKNLVYYTNDWSLAEYYTRAFRLLKVSNFRFIIVPATWRSEDGK